MHKLVNSHNVHHKIHGSGIIGKLNAKIAVVITRLVGSMWCAYVFIFIALVSLPQALTAFLSGDTVTGISWLSQSLIQLVLLPIILVGTRVLTETQDQRAATDHETLVALHEINVTQLSILEALRKQVYVQSTAK